MSTLSPRKGLNTDNYTRCDRILWKTTIVPKPQGNNGRRRSSLKLWSPTSISGIRRSTSLSRPDSTPLPEAGIVEEDGSIALPKLVPASTRAEIINPSNSNPGSGSEHSSDGLTGLLARFLPRGNSNARTMDKRSKTLDVPTTSNLNGIGNGLNFARKLTIPGPAQGRDRGDSDPGITQSQSESANPGLSAVSNVSNSSAGTNLAMRWLNALLPNRETSTAPSTAVEEKEAPPPPVVHRKGEVICLHYGTLDDAAMRRLEGRSDHRPILGTFSVYV